MSKLIAWMLFPIYSNLRYMRMVRRKASYEQFNYYPEPLRSRMIEGLKHSMDIPLDVVDDNKEAIRDIRIKITLLEEHVKKLYGITNG